MFRVMLILIELLMLGAQKFLRNRCTVACTWYYVMCFAVQLLFGYRKRPHVDAGVGVGVGVGADVEVEVEVEVDVGVDVGVNVDVEVDVEGEVEFGVDAGVDADVDV